MKFAQPGANLCEIFRTNLSTNRNKNSCIKSNFDIRPILAVKFGVASVKSQANLATNLGVKWRTNADLRANLKIISGVIKTKSQTNFYVNF